MQKTGPIIVIEDDGDDQYILDTIFKKLNYPNEIIYFSDGHEALEHITNTDVQPFLILSDINMPKISGLELRKKIRDNEKLNVKCIPYLFFTTSADSKSVLEAYSMSVQGFFQKSGRITDLENTLRKIIEYWQECYAPSHFV